MFIVSLFPSLCQATVRILETANAPLLAFDAMVSDKSLRVRLVKVIHDILLSYSNASGFRL